ncbi:MAG TPA: SIS domain-containing protein [Candidatus Limnocylindrales bacterium]
MGLRDEIAEQPAVIRRLLGEGRSQVEAVADRIRAADVEHVVIAARGTSDHAAIYAQYVFGIRHRLPVALAAPSITTLFGVEPAFRRSVVIGISQSGASPDIVAVVEAARRQGVPTIAITNTPGSPLASAAGDAIDLLAEAETAVAATKTYTAELTAIAMLSAALARDAAAFDALEAIPTAIEAALASENEVVAVAGAHATLDRCVVLGRGFEYATAREVALKLKELAHVVADPYSSADFQHGPVALVEPGFTVLAFAPSGLAGDGLVELVARLRSEHRADVVVVSDRPGLAGAGSTIPLPGGVPEWLMPIASVVPGQLLAFHLARARGLDPDAPRNLRKVTLTR